MDDLHPKALELSPIGMLAVDSDGSILMVNTELERMFGIPRDELLGAPVEKLIPTRFASTHHEVRDAFLSTPETRPMGAGRTLFGCRSDGTEFPVEVGLNTIDTDAHGIIVVASVADISERHHAEARFRAAFESNVSGLIMVDDQGLIRDANISARAKFGYEADELIGMSINALVPERFRGGHGDHIRSFMNQATSRRMGVGRDLYAVRKDGEEFPVEIGLIPVDAEGKRYVLANIIDISARKSTESLIRAKQRAESISLLANGIAHDFNNTLQSIITLAELGQMMDDPDEIKGLLDTMISAAGRGSKLVRRILTVGRSVETPRHPLRPAPVLTETLEIFRASLPRTIRFETDVDATSPEILSDPTMLHQVVMNLVTNSMHAMPDGGTLMVVARGMSVTTGRNGWHVPSGLYLYLAVVDTGSGMAPETLERAFDPFYTTKGLGEGSGMGLAVVKSIVDTHGGEIRITSDARGTNIELLLPSTSRVSSDASKDERKGPKVMLVDDEQTLGVALEQLLKRTGCAAKYLPSGVEALAMIDAQNDWDLIIVDQSMPEMGGLELVEKIRERLPDVPIAMVTGNQPPSADVIEDLGVTEVLLKPVRAKDLNGLVQRIVRRSS